MNNPILTNTTAKLAAPVHGHDHFFLDIAKAASIGRMQHAWLLTGPTGIGKASTAKLAAAWLLSEKGESGLSGGMDTLGVNIDAGDPGANLVLKGAHPDYKLVSPKVEDNKSGQIKIDQIRELFPFMMHKPARCGWRVAVIDSMDLVNRSGANALLKLLEEPPDRAVLFLVATKIGLLPPTIRSRCRLVRMTRLSPEACLIVLRHIWPDADTSQLDILVKISKGAPGQALQLADSGAIDLYQTMCELLQTTPFNQSAFANVCAKWGRGKVAGHNIRAGAIFCIDRLLRHAALSASAVRVDHLCDFEVPVIKFLASNHTAEQLARFHHEFVRNAMQAERLHLDFPRFLERHLVKIYEKTLP